jgi:protease IV
MLQKKTKILLWIVIGGGALLFFILCLAVVATVFSGGSSASFSLSADQVALLEVEGIISDSKEFADQLKEYGGRCKSVVIRINSPGGGVAASQEIHDAIKKFRAETKKTVVVSMYSVAASGGYYVACASDKIYANPGTITGSIGVIAEWYNYGDLLKWAKMQDVVIKSGALKDAGSPTRPLTEAEKVYFQALIKNLYGQFVSDVVKGRPIKEEDVLKLADGRVYTGLQAKENHLIDEIGTLQDAIAAAAKMAGIQGTPKLVSPAKRRFSILDAVLGDSRSAIFPNMDRSESHIRFEYLWR